MVLLGSCGLEVGGGSRAQGGSLSGGGGGIGMVYWRYFGLVWRWCMIRRLVVLERVFFGSAEEVR